MRITNLTSSRFCVAVLATAAAAYCASLGTADRQFMTMAARANMTEAHEGQMAEAQASQAQVKDFGRTLVQDHTDAYVRLSEVAAKTGVSIPKGINTGRDRTIQQLTHLKGAAFDRQFARDEIAAHRQAVAAFKREADHGSNPDVKEYASKMVPTLEKHLQLAENLVAVKK